uniref:Pre-peptidase C-terminal domain-containing protein n=1 Tax=Candidatus Kentrum sp. TUN TaxID=2126343 RepID=A0A450ZWH4_9GAMM|nr:MAG: pre-peptidase C-terminal domain-containing protein [Candidatus Kentron sp. TUN]VFK67125.1 MAG: pre-peptidase C-terminal domain-containing protein [Candidatus Kentron sp. TUN]
MILAFSNIAYSFDKENANLKWDAVRGTLEESTFLIDLFIREKMPGEYPQLVKQRFREIATPTDAALLLDKLVDPGQRNQHIFVYTLLKELEGDDFVRLLHTYFDRAPSRDVRNKLFNLITRQNCVVSFKVATKIIGSLQIRGLNDEAIAFLDYMVRFNHPDIRQEAINGVSSASTIIRAASYVALRNYPDQEVQSIIDNALSTETAKITGEENYQRYGNSSVSPTDTKNSLTIDILKTTRKEMERTRQRSDNQRTQNTNREPRFEAQVHAVSAGSSDRALAETYAPQLRLSGPGAVGVNIWDSNYKYTDYIPINVNDLTSNQNRKINIYLANTITYNGRSYGPGNVQLGDGTIDIIGDTVFRSSSNYLDFSPIWDGALTFVSDGYKTLSLNPTVYFKVTKDPHREYPIAIQYWFFYFYNDWLVFDHPGDWETITVFLNANAQPAEVAYSTHYEANRASWRNISPIGNHPKVYISNGGHGSYYESGNTTYSNICVPKLPNPCAMKIKINDNYEGEKKKLNFDNGDYSLIDLNRFENYYDNNWIWFKGRWGDKNSAPQGPLFRTDGHERFWSLHPPFDPYANCSEREPTNIYGDNQDPGPWFWASGYGLNTPWENARDCKPLTQCVDSIGFNTKQGTWDSSSCASMHRSGRYAKYYTFTLSSEQAVVIDLKSSTDTYLFLLNDSGLHGSVVERDDDGGDGRDSRITRTLSAGTYTIEATTYSSKRTGDFSVSLAKNDTSKSCIDSINFNSSVLDSWESSCASTHRSGKYAKYYTFTLSSSRTVTINLQSSTDTYLFLLRGYGQNGSVIERDDDGGSGLNSRIVRYLSAGSYTIEATTYSSRATGNFSVSIQ